MSDFEGHLEQQLREIREQGLSRSLRRIESAQGTLITFNDRILLNFSSNDYLGLANDERLKEASIKAIERYGAGSGASRLICGSLAPHHKLEEALASFKRVEAALTFSSGYAAALGTIGAVLEKDDIVIVDRLVHASVVDAVRLSRAQVRIYGHNNLNELEDLLRWATNQPKEKSAAKTRPRILVVTEGVFSMDGDLAPLREIVELKEKHGAWLMVDEAHATGLYGSDGAGLANQLRLSNQIEIQMGTLGKALGASGGYIAGSRKLIDYLVNRARSFIFSTAAGPAASAAAAAAVAIANSNEGDRLRKTLWQRVAQAGQLLKSMSPEPQSAILPIIIGEEATTLAAAARLIDHGLFVPGIRYPSVARGQARLRLTVTAAHTETDVQDLGRALREIDLGAAVRMNQSNLTSSD